MKSGTHGRASERNRRFASVALVATWRAALQHGALRCNMPRCVATWHAALLHAALYVQVYDQHLGAVNTITFIDDNRRWLSGFHSRPRGLTRDAARDAARDRAHAHTAVSAKRARPSRAQPPPPPTPARPSRAGSCRRPTTRRSLCGIGASPSRSNTSPTHPCTPCRNAACHQKLPRRNHTPTSARALPRSHAHLPTRTRTRTHAHASAPHAYAHTAACGCFRAVLLLAA